MKLGPAAHRNIFLLACLCLTVMLIVAAVLAGRDEAAHKSYYEQYKAADELFESGQFEAPYEVYKRLSGIYDDSYILELKMMVCAMQMGLWEEAAEHTRRTIKLYPLLASDVDFMHSLSYILRQLGETGAAQEVEDYFHQFIDQGV